MIRSDETSIPILTPDEWLARIDDPDQGTPIPTIFSPLIPDFAKGRCTILGASTGVGKTLFGLQAWRHVVDMGLTAAYVTLEMTPSDLFTRLTTQFSGEDAARQWIKDNNPYVSESFVDAHEIERIIKQGFDFVVVDHIHEIPFDGHEDLGRKVKRLSSLAPATNTALLMLSQLKQPDPGFERPPTIWDFSWTKAIPEAASVALAIWQENEEENFYQIYTLKNRYGRKPDPVDVYLREDTVTFQLNN